MRIPTLGDVLEGKYRLDETLGEGGFGVVYGATTLSTGRRVAAKFLKPSRGGYDVKHVSRFLRELKAIAQLQSPHTLTLFDYGQTPDGVLFMICEYVDGADLSDLLLQRDRLTEREALHVLYQLLLSLAEAHQHGVLHRDLKPANIRIFSYAGDPLRAKLLDFGIALSMDDQSARLTATGKAIGTPRYMSPEQLQGVPLGPASDIYSLGLVFCEMLRGRASTALEPGVHRRLEPDPREGLRDDVTRVLAKMVDPDPATRYADAQKVLADVRALIRTDLPVAVERTTQPEILRAPPPPALSGPDGTSWPVRNVHLWGVLATVMILLVFSSVLIVHRVDPPEPLPAEARDVSSLVRAPKAVAPNSPAAVVDAGWDASSARSDAQPHSSGCGAKPGLAGIGELRLIKGLDVVTLNAIVPPDYDPARPYPLLVLAHENAEAPGEFLRYSGFEEVAAHEGFVVVAPFGGGPYAWDEADSVAVLRDSVAKAEESLCIDPTRIYALGHGAGGRVVERLACEAPEFAAIVTTRRGEVDDVLCQPESPIPTLQISAMNDRYNPVKGGKSCSGAMKISLATKEAHWREVNHCEAKPTTWERIDEHVCTAWDCEVDVVSCHVRGGRAWPNQKNRLMDQLSGNKCDGPKSTFPYPDVAWKFLSQYRLDGG